MPKLKDRTGEKIGRILIVSRSDKRPRAWWNCKCDCGNECVVSSVFLDDSPCPSCGCHHKETYGQHMIKHGHAPTKGKAQSPTYATWRGMKLRCLNTNHKGFKDYGARGIKICDSWLAFEGFLADMGDRPENSELERKDNSLGYCKENCIWTTHSINCRNTRSNNVIEFNGQRLCLAEWAEKTGIGWHTLYYRLNRGWTVEKTLTEPVS